MQLVFIISAIVCFIVAFLALEVRGLRFEWLGFALLAAAIYLPL